MKEDVGTKIEAVREAMGERLLILGHHYQRSNVLQHADERGDSLELARKAARYTAAETIVFCGVRFMAESADILTSEDQRVFMPDTRAGCPMANMGDRVTMERAWKMLERARPGGWRPIVYVNSSAEVKACCGRWQGMTCTSSNAARAFEWVFSQDRGVFFLPDEHLGVNSAHDLGIDDKDVLVYDPHAAWGGLDLEAVSRARVIVWKGFCLVHTAFSREQIRRVRTELPKARIIVHPEAPKEVVRAADAHGSTSQIIRYVREAPEGAVIVVGTELNLVDRLADEHKGRVTVKALWPSVCANMSRTNEENLLAVLETRPASHEVRVPAPVARDARKALERMLEM